MSPRPLPVLDLHCHAAGIGAGGSGCRISDRLRRSPRFGVYLRAYGVTEKELRREGDALVIARLAQRLAASGEVAGAVVLALDGVVDDQGRLDGAATELYVPDRFVAEETARYPNLLFGASVNPLRRDALERLDEAAARGAALVKWLPPVQGIDLADPRHAAFYLRLAELGLPLLTHTGTERSFTRSRDPLGDPERLRLPLSLGVTVIAAHGAAAGRTGRHPNFRRLAALAGQYPNLWADVSSLTQVNHPGALVRLLREPAFQGRLLYGTDMPLIATSLVSPWFFAPVLGLASARKLARIPNPWDRDVALKRALGTPQAVFEAPARLLGRLKKGGGLSGPPDAAGPPPHHSTLARPLPAGPSASPVGATRPIQSPRSAYPRVSQFPLPVAGEGQGEGGRPGLGAGCATRSAPGPASRGRIGSPVASFSGVHLREVVVAERCSPMFRRAGARGRRRGRRR